MCDYSLMGIPNRLAKEGESLIAHRFPMGSMGLTSPAYLSVIVDGSRDQAQGFWSALKSFFKPPRDTSIPAVCVPPGARLTLQDIPRRLQLALNLGPEEEVTFTQLTAQANTYRDAVRFKNGHHMLLQNLNEGQRAKVTDLSLAEVIEPVQDERFGSTSNRR